MPDVEFALLANAVQVSSGDRLINMLGGGWDTGTLPEEAYPAGVVLHVVFRVTFDQEEAGKTYSGAITVQSEDEQRLTAITLSLDVGDTEDLPPGWKLNVPVASPVPVQFPSPGLYSVSITIDNQILKTIPLRMKATGA